VAPGPQRRFAHLVSSAGREPRFSTSIRRAQPTAGAASWRSQPVSAFVTTTDHPGFLSAEECLAHAEICERKALFLSDPEDLRRMLLEVAAQWRKLARDDEARSKA
jgi:hypothetical protein